MSSHAIELKRVLGLHFEVAVFTNLTRDHLDLHKDMRSYFLAKKKLFTGLDGTIPRVLVLNIDDPYFGELKAIAPSRVISYGMDPAADVSPTHYDSMPVGKAWMPSSEPHWEIFRSVRSCWGNPTSTTSARRSELRLALGCLRKRSARESPVCRWFLDVLKPVNAGQSFRVIVDFAHTDDASGARAAVRTRNHCRGASSWCSVAAETVTGRSGR